MKVAFLFVLVAGLVPGLLVACSDRATSEPNCEETLDAYCSRNSCVRDWATARARATSCKQGASVSIAEGCSGYNAVRGSGTDSETTDWYEQSTGKLVAVTMHSIGSARCAAAHSTFVPPSCSTDAWVCTGADDGGTD